MIQTVKITRLRGIRHGTIEPLTPLSVLVWPNGCGKSTILDALFIGAHVSPPDAVGRVVQRRRSTGFVARWLFWHAGTEGNAFVETLTDAADRRVCELSLAQNNTVVQCDTISSGGSSSRARGQTGFQQDGQYHCSPMALPLNGIPDVRLVESHYVAVDEPLHRLYSRSVESGNRLVAKEIVGKLIPGVTGLEILTDLDVPVMHVVLESGSVPVSVIGDGAQMILRLALQLAAPPMSLVLLEEPEIHQHPGAIFQTAAVILEAMRNEVQVVLSTHSLELIDALLAEVRDDTELEKLAVFRVRLENGEMTTLRVKGTDVAFARSEIGDDLR